MVMAIIEPIAAGVIVSLLNKYVLSGQCWRWTQQSCETAVEIIEEESEEEKVGNISSTTTTVSDASVHVHCH